MNTINGYVPGEEKKEILSFKEALPYLDISASLLYKMTSKKTIPFTKPNGGKIYFKKSDLDKWMMRNLSINTAVSEEDVINHLNRKNG